MAEGSGRKAKEAKFRSHKPGEQHMALGRERSEVRRHRGKKIDLNGFNGLNDVNNRTGEYVLSGGPSSVDLSLFIALLG